MAEHKQSPSSPKVLLIDIETLPAIGFCWGKWEQNILSFQQQGCIATVAYKWLHDPVVKCMSITDYKTYKPNSYDDKLLLQDLWKLLNEADIVIAHNGDAFDVKEINARFIFHKITPPAPYKTVDTKTLAQKVARFKSNKLDDLGELLEEGRKIKTDFDLWKGCVEGDMKCWEKMIRYNKKDVILLERIYLRLLPWSSQHPNLGLWKEDVVCPNCGSDKLQFRGDARTLTRIYRRMQCTTCGSWSRLLKSEKGRGAQARSL